MSTITISSTAIAFAKFPLPFPSTRNSPQALPLPRRTRPTAAVSASLSAATDPVPSKPDELVETILLKVMQTDRGVALTKDEHQKVAEIADELQNFCVDEPVKCPLIFGEWDVVYCSNPTLAGGPYRSALGRLVLKTKEMIQVVEAPDVIRNRVSFSVLGFVDGEVSLKGKVRAVDEKWIQVVLEPPELKVGGAEFKYGCHTEVKLETTYIDHNIRLGKASKGSLFVFQRKKPIS